jgi:anti-sigma factor RsiW
MKRGCQQIELLFAAYVDDEAETAERATVDAHLRACPPCRDRIAGERAARDVLRARRTGLRPCASPALRARCAAQGVSPAIRSGLLSRRALIPLSLAAAVVLAVSSSLFFFGNTVEVLAAQLAVDHVKCFQFAPDRGARPVRVDPLTEARSWETSYGWPLKVPASAVSEELELIGVRRCLSSEGRVAHMMYRWHGQPLSVFVLNSRAGGTNQGQPEIEEVVTKMGENTVIWSRGDRTYAVVARGPSPDLQQVARYVRRASE